MLLYCAVCGKPFRQAKDRPTDPDEPKPKRGPPQSCPRCRGPYHAARARLHWKHRRRRLGLAREVAVAPAPKSLPDLETLMAEADAAAERALKLAGAIADGDGKPVAKSAAGSRLPQVAKGRIIVD